MRTRIPILAVQSAIFSRIKADYPTRDIFVYVPGQNKLPPFITLGASICTHGGTKTSIDFEVSLQIHCWSQSTGNTEVVGMVNEVLNSLTRAELDLAADQFRQYMVELERTDISAEFGDEAGLIQHGIIAIKFGVEDISQAF
jgi:hypothetical protein